MTRWLKPEPFGLQLDVSLLNPTAPRDLQSDMENMEDLFDGLDSEEDFESLACSFKYVRVCLLLPAVNGFLNAFLWPAYTLYYDEMEWPLVQAGAAVSVGFGSRVLMQQLQLKTGYWLIVPLSLLHLIIVILALIFQTNQWAVFAQLVVWLAIDPTAAIEGIAFDSFGDSEVQARQATSTVLSVFTIAFACSCTLGGILYDASGWTGMALYHLSLQGLMTLLLACEPACRQSFMAVFFTKSQQLETMTAETSVAASVPTLAVVPKPLPGKEQLASLASLPAAVNSPAGSPLYSEGTQSPKKAVVVKSLGADLFHAGFASCCWQQLLTVRVSSRFQNTVDSWHVCQQR